VKDTVQHTAVSDALLLWLACAFAACAGGGLAFGVLGAAIDAQHLRTAHVSQVAAVDARVLARRPSLEREAARLTTELRGLTVEADRPTIVAHFIRIASAATAAHHVTITEIEERSAPMSTTAPLPSAASAAGGVPPAPGSNFEAIPLEVTLDGSYPDLLATIRELAQTPLVMQIHVASLERSAPGSALCARLRIELERLAAPPLTGRPVILAPSEDPSIHARPR
jgi:hypothetical protein